MRYEMTYGCSGDKEGVRVASDASNTVFTALRDAASAAYWVSYRLHAPADSTYIMIPACAYDGNRFEAVHRQYPPMFTEEEFGLDVPVRMTEAPRLSREGEEECSADIRKRVEAAREIQRRRYADDPDGIRINAQLSARNLNAACRTSDEAHQLLLLSCERLKLSNRAYTRVLKVARTIADLAGSERIEAEHVSEAVQYRTLDRKYWG